MSNLKKAAMGILKNGQDMSVGDKLLALKVIKEFEDQFRAVTGEYPKKTDLTQQLIAQRLEE